MWYVVASLTASHVGGVIHLQQLVGRKIRACLTVTFHQSAVLGHGSLACSR